MLNKQKGNMYGFVTHTWNPIKGKCPHECSYCYMKRFPQGELRFDEKCFGDFLIDDAFIFVGSSTDMFAQEIPTGWIKDVLKFCKNYKSKFLFQSKNPAKFGEFAFPKNTILATTIETNRQPYIDKYSKAPPVFERVTAMQKINTNNKQITIEPIMDFDIDAMITIVLTGVKQVNIGADSGGNNLPEPSADKIEALIKELRKFTKVHLKDNLKRLYKETP
jgi:DNA repair photolyase